MTVITVCITCRRGEAREDRTLPPCGEAMLALVEDSAAEAEAVTVRGTACLMGCDHGCNVAISAPGKMSYVLGSFAPEQESAEALVAYAALHAESEEGVVAYKQWPSGVKGHVVARVPPLD